MHIFAVIANIITIIVSTVIIHKLIDGKYNYIIVYTIIYSIILGMAIMTVIRSALHLLFL